MIATKPDKKTFKCTSCDATHIKWVGKCHFCNSWGSIVEVSVKQKVYQIPKKSKKTKLALEENKGIDTDLQKWFLFQREYELSNGQGICENCGTSVRNFLNSKDEWMWKSCFLHIIPKKTYKSVSTNVNNFVIGCISCHQTYDTSWAKAITMPIFAKAKQKFKLFQHLITESTTHLPKELID